MNEKLRLREVEIAGFKSIARNRKGSIPFGDVTVLLGANGSGKSCLVSFFRLLNFMMSGALQEYVGREGAGRLLHYGPSQTEFIEFSMLFSFDSGKVQDLYGMRLAYGIPDRLFVAGETVGFSDGRHDQPFMYHLPSNSGESGLLEHDDTTSQVICGLLRGVRTYQFHDTSDTAKIKQRGYVDDARYLRHDGGNLAAFLHMLKGHDQYQRYYQRILRHVQRVMPQFGDFQLDAIPGQEDYVRLNWTDHSGEDYLFDPGQLSDGSLRFMALATLLLQPPDLLPSFIVLDEPELGLHPAAIAELAGMVRTASKHAQVLLATQSTRLVDEFGPESLVIVERDEENRCSLFRKPDEKALAEWLANYSLSELWEKNVLGGQP